MKIGDKAKLINAKDLGKHGFRKGDLCSINSMASVDGKDLAMIMPDGSFKFYWVQADRLEVVEEEKEEISDE